jgi:hypothetical protein
MNTSGERLVFNDKMILIQEEPRGATLLVEIPVTAGNQSVTLPIVSELQNDPTQTIVIKGIRLVTVAELAFAPTDGAANAPLTELQKISFQVYAEGWQKGYNIPLLSFNNTFTEGSGIPYRDKTTKLANWQFVQWNKCKLIYSNGQPSVGAYNVIIEVEYVRFDKDGKEIFGPGQ